MQQQRTTRGRLAEMYGRALWLHQLSVDAHSVFLSYAYVHAALFALFYASALSLGALMLSDAILAVSVIVSLGTRLVSLIYTERMMRAQTRQR